MIEAGELPVPAGLLDTLDLLNRKLPEIAGDHRGIALVDIKHPWIRDAKACSFTLDRWEETVQPLSRGAFDVALVSSGSRICRLGHYAAHVLAPGLAAFVDRHFGSAPPERLFTRAERRDRLDAEGRAATAAARQARELQTLGEIGQVLFNEDTPESRERAKRLITAIDGYRAAIAAK